MKIIKESQSPEKWVKHFFCPMCESTLEININDIKIKNSYNLVCPDCENFVCPECEKNKKTDCYFVCSECESLILINKEDIPYSIYSKAQELATLKKLIN